MTKTHSHGGVKCCLRCHFLKQRWRDIDDKDRLVDETTRKVLGSNSVFANHFTKVYGIGCYEKVWTYESLNKDDQENLLPLLNQDRGESCFFYPYTPGALFPAAAELERRKTASREAKRKHHLVIISIIVAAILAILTAILGFFD